MEPTIRHAALGDATGIAEVYVRTWQSTYRGLIPGDVPEAMTLDLRTPFWEQLLADVPQGHGLLVTGTDANIVSVVSFGPARDASGDDQALALNTLYATPSSQGRGTVTALLAAAGAPMRQAGATRVDLAVLDGSQGPQRFCRKHGWKPDGVSKADIHCDVPVHVVRFRKPLFSTGGSLQREPTGRSVPVPA